VRVLVMAWLVEAVRNYDITGSPVSFSPGGLYDGPPTLFPDQ